MVAFSVILPTFVYQRAYSQANAEAWQGGDKKYSGEDSFPHTVPKTSAEPTLQALESRIFLTDYSEQLTYNKRSEPCASLLLPFLTCTCTSECLSQGICLQQNPWNTTLCRCILPFFLQILFVHTFEDVPWSYSFVPS